MLRSGKRIRFTRSEMAEFKQYGFDLAEVKTLADWQAVVRFWAETLAEEAPSPVL